MIIVQMIHYYIRIDRLGWNKQRWQKPKKKTKKITIIDGGLIVVLNYSFLNKDGKQMGMFCYPLYPLLDTFFDTITEKVEKKK